MDEIPVGVYRDEIRLIGTAGFHNHSRASSATNETFHFAIGMGSPASETKNSSFFSWEYYSQKRV